MAAWLSLAPISEVLLPLPLNDAASLAELKEILVANGWTWLTAVNTMLFRLLHWPCTTALLSAYKESGSKKWTLTAFLLPTIAGISICMLVAAIAHGLGWA